MRPKRTPAYYILLFAGILLCFGAQRASDPSLADRDAQIKAARSEAKRLWSQDFSFVGYGWTRTDVRHERIAAQQAQAQLSSPTTALTTIREILKKGPIRANREEILRAMVALTDSNVYYLPSFAANRREIVSRNNAWKASLTLTEYRWRTLAQIDSPHRELLPALVKLSRDAPFDWRTEVAAINHYVRFGRRAEGLTKARKLARGYPRHSGTQVEVARVLSYVAEAERSSKLYDEAEELLKRAQVLGPTPSERAYMEQVRSILLGSRKRTGS